MESVDWTQYKQDIADFYEVVGLQLVTWHRFTFGIDREAEGDKDNFTDVSIKALIQWNAFRTWPSTVPTPSGDIDKENAVMFLGIQYLEDNGWLDGNRYFNFNPGKDTFTIEGQLYSPFGDIKVAQAGDAGIMQMVILKREEKETGG